MQAMAGNLGGVLAAFIYLSTDSPQYVKGHSILIGILAMSATISATLSVYYRYENKRRDAEFKDPKLYSVEEKMAERTKGDAASFFRFTV